jgi:DNA invertase Pin-like site-specific DNA recombinase
MTFPIFTPNPRVFDDSKAREIRSIYFSGGMSYRALARHFGASKATIEHVIRGRGAYRHLRDEQRELNFSTDW